MISVYHLLATMLAFDQKGIWQICVNHEVKPCELVLAVLSRETGSVVFLFFPLATS